MADLLARLADAPRRARGASSDFDLNPGAAPSARPLKEAAVLIAVTPAAEILLTRRTAHLKHHAGQIAFPGGRQDPEDADLTETALREAHEEIGLPRAAARILGALPPHETVTGYRVTPILARTEAFAPAPEPGEVAEIFAVPLAHLAAPGHFRVERRLWGGAWRHYYAVPWGPYYIWGATARILRALAEALNAD